MPSVDRSLISLTPTKYFKGDQDGSREYMMYEKLPRISTFALLALVPRMDSNGRFQTLLVPNRYTINPFSAEPIVVNSLCGWQGVNGVYSCTNCANIISNTWASFPDNT